MAWSGSQTIFDGGHDEAAVSQLGAHELTEVPSVLGEEHAETRPRVSHDATPRENVN